MSLPVSLHTMKAGTADELIDWVNNIPDEDFPRVDKTTVIQKIKENNWNCHDMIKLFDAIQHSDSSDSEIPKNIAVKISPKGVFRKLYGYEKDCLKFEKARLEEDAKEARALASPSARELAASALEQRMARQVTMEVNGYKYHNTQIDPHVTYRLKILIGETVYEYDVRWSQVENFNKQMNQHLDMITGGNLSCPPLRKKRRKTMNAGRIEKRRGQLDTYFKDMAKMLNKRTDNPEVLELLKGQIRSHFHSAEPEPEPTSPVVQDLPETL